MEEQVSAEKVYRLSRAGRRMAYLLLAGSALIWLFALWTLKSTLKIALKPQNLLPSVKLLVKRLLGIGGANPLTPEEAIPALIMIVLAVAIPLLIWNIVEELRSCYIVRPGGISFQSGSIELSYPWEEIAALRPVEDETEEAMDELVLRTSHLSAIRNPLVRFLHWQAYGSRKLPLFGGVENREELVATVRGRMKTAAAQAASAPAVAETVATESASTPAVAETAPPEPANPPVAIGEGQDIARG